MKETGRHLPDVVAAASATEVVVTAAALVVSTAAAVVTATDKSSRGRRSRSALLSSLLEARKDEPVVSTAVVAAAAVVETAAAAVVTAARKDRGGRQRLVKDVRLDATGSSSRLTSVASWKGKVRETRDYQSHDSARLSASRLTRNDGDTAEGKGRPRREVSSDASEQFSSGLI